MDIRRVFLPDWRIESPTDLTCDEIGHRLTENIITGASFYSRKPYYGKVTPQGFSVRRPWSRLKKMSLAPSVTGKYGVHDGKMVVNLRVRPHPVWLVIFVLCVSQCILYWVEYIPEIFGTRNADLLVTALLPLAAVYVIPWFAFRHQCGIDLRFWSEALQLREPPH